MFTAICWAIAIVPGREDARTTTAAAKAPRNTKRDVAIIKLSLAPWFAALRRAAKSNGAAREMFHYRRGEPGWLTLSEKTRAKKSPSKSTGEVEHGRQLSGERRSSASSWRVSRSFS